jgi:phenylacetate-CoA ligase
MPFRVQKSGIDGITWPPLATGLPASLAALMHQLEDTQWLTPDEITQRQHQQLVSVATHAATHSAHFKNRLKASGIQVAQLATEEGLRAIPEMDRRELQSAGDSLFCRRLPRHHMPVEITQTSGSSGETVTVKRTAINHLFWLALTLREHLWHQRDFLGKLAIIRARYPAGQPESRDAWGPPVSLFYDTGTSHAMQITTDVAQQAAWLEQLNPDYLLTYPNNLAALLQQLERDGTKLPQLRQVRSIGETLAPQLREATRHALHVEIADTYSSQEAGAIALQCPESGMYHVMAESLMVEVLDDSGAPCTPGQIGRVVITDLHNFATPLIRYSIGDYAEVGPACPCGRGLPTLKRIVGRERNILLLPDGRRHWPLFGAHNFSDIAPIRQYQVIQRDRDLLEVRLVSDSPVTPEQEKRLGGLIHAALGFPFQLRFVYFPDKIPRGPGGKFEEFVCEVK